MSFLTSNIDPQKVRQKEFYVCHQEAVKRIHEGESLWESESNQMKEFRTYVEHNWLIIPSNTQLVERWVKDANECCFNTKDENLADAIAILRSTSIFRFRRKAKQLYDGRILSALTTRPCTLKFQCQAMQPSMKLVSLQQITCVGGFLMVSCLLFIFLRKGLAQTHGMRT